MLEHGVEENQQLAHAGCEGQLLGLSSGQQQLVEVPDDGVEAAGYQRTHVQGGADPGASTPDGAFAPQGAAVPVEGSHLYQGGDLPAVQRAQLRQIGQESERELLSHAGNGAQEVILLSPYGTMTKSLPQFPRPGRPALAPAMQCERRCGDGRRWWRRSGGSSPRPAWSSPGAYWQPGS